MTASAYELDVAATDAGERQRGVKRIEVLVDGVQVHDSGAQSCGSGGCPLDTSYVLRPQWFAPGDRKVEVISTDQVNNKRKDERTIKVPSEPSNTAGLEQWYQYDSVATGAGTQAHVNLSTGNLVWHGLPVVNLGRGLSTYVNLSYNSADKGGQGQHEGGLNNEADGPNYNQAGQNVSLGIGRVDPSSTSRSLVSQRHRRRRDDVRRGRIEAPLQEVRRRRDLRPAARRQPAPAQVLADQLHALVGDHPPGRRDLLLRPARLPDVDRGPQRQRRPLRLRAAADADPSACTSGQEWASDLNCKKRVVRVTRLGGRRGRAGRREPLRRRPLTTRRPFPRATATPPGASRE